LTKCGVGDAREPERKDRREIERGRRGVRESHNALLDERAPIRFARQASRCENVCGSASSRSKRNATFA
jgi:hypothetical protein